ncbi:DUF5949 family protein [Streptomyces xiaopingdaonensis]|uniref:DUF5949 family protein n=1 Tax=Streptomyces xiaopingdaonensis TaxID=1565415 RepID=UPI000494CE70|nr:DUF5949 family protein [Streptomyces xiaopingdaonensis]
MTSTQAGMTGFRPSLFGTMSVLGWTGPHPDDGEDVPFLLAYSLGDGEEGPQGGAEAARQLLRETGLPIGGEVPDASHTRRLPMTLLVQGGQAALTMPHVSVRYPAPTEWLTAAQDRGEVYFMFATLPWPEARPGAEVTEEQLRGFVDEEMMASSAHCMLPVSGLRR